MAVGTSGMFVSRRAARGVGVDQARQALTDVFLPVDFPAARASSVVDLELNALKVVRLTCGYISSSIPYAFQTAEAESYHIDIPTRGRATMRAGTAHRCTELSRPLASSCQGDPSSSTSASASPRSR